MPSHVPAHVGHLQDLNSERILSAVAVPFSIIVSFTVMFYKIGSNFFRTDKLMLHATKATLDNNRKKH